MEQLRTLTPELRETTKQVVLSINIEYNLHDALDQTCRPVEPQNQPDNQYY